MMAFVTASLLVLAGGGLVAAVELQHKANLQLAWYVHSPKTGEASLMNALEQCIKCTGTANRGPAGQFVNQMDQVGLLPTASMSGRLAKLKEEASLASGQCDNIVPHSAGLKCTPGSGEVDDNVLCKEGILSRSHHWTYDLVGKPLESLVRNAEYQPVVVGSTHNPFTYYLSHYFFALESQHRTPYKSGGLPKFGPEHDVCLPVVERLGKACVAAFRTWLRQRLLTKPLWKVMQRYYGSNASIVPSWAWVQEETLGPSIERVLERITGRPLPGDALSCLRHRLRRKPGKGTIGDLDAARPYYTRELIALVDHVDREIFERFNYSSLSTDVETLEPKEPAPTIHTELLGRWSYNETARVPWSSLPSGEAQHICSSVVRGNKNDCAVFNKPRLDEPSCPDSLGKYSYEGNDSFEAFNVDLFRQKMVHKRIVMVGSSLMRQQYVALGMALGPHIQTLKEEPIIDAGLQGCGTFALSRCFVDVVANITVCLQRIATMATHIYTDGAYRLNHTRRGHGDSSCILRPSSLTKLASFDIVLVQSLSWWTNLPTLLDSKESPKAWVDSMLTTVYTDALRALLTPISKLTKTVFVLGQTGQICQDRTVPDVNINSLFTAEVSAGLVLPYGWTKAAGLWKASLDLIQASSMDVEIVDVRKPLMAAVNAHPGSACRSEVCESTDCLHFCMNSAAVYSSLGMYQSRGIF